MIKSKKQFINPESIFTNAMKKVRKDEIESSKKFFDVISFAEEMLSLKLFPAQRIVLKMFYAGTKYNETIRLTDEEVQIVKDWSLPQTWIFEGERSKYKAYLNNIDNFSKNPSNNYFRELILILGRRSGKSWMSSLISVYEAYKLVSVPDPVAELGIGDGDIWIINTATTGLQAKTIIFKQIKKFVNKCPIFDGRICKDEDDLMILFTDADLKTNEKRKDQGLSALQGNVVLASGTSNSKALRGHSSSILVFDEMAHFVDTDGKASAGSTYQALQPSIANLLKFGEGRNVIISSPDLPSGFFYDHFEDKKTEDTALVFQIPTWDANPNVTRESLEPEFKSDPDKAAAEYGAQFRHNASSNFLPPIYIDEAMRRREGWNKKEQGGGYFHHYMHLDPAKNSDRWAVLIGHAEYRFDEATRKSLLWIVEDYSRTFAPPPGGVLDPDDLMDNFILPLFKKFNIISVTSDQFFSLEQQKKLIRNGHRFREYSFNGATKNKIYMTLKDFFINGRIVLCADDTDLGGELKNLRIDYTKNPPRISKTETDKTYPNDDLADCLGGVAYSICEGVQGTTRFPPSRLVNTGRR